MKRDGVYRFNLQFPSDSEERIRVGEVLERLGKRKSHLVVAALGEYLDRHPQWETPEVRVKIEQQSAMSREKLEELVRRLVEEKLASLPVSVRKPIPPWRKSSIRTSPRCWRTWSFFKARITTR